MNDVISLSNRFNTPHAQIVTGNGDLPKIVVAHPLCEGELYLQGAHVTQWQPPGAEAVLWVSPLSAFAEGKAIRGGVPICFPWFGPKASDPSAATHGFARNRPWTIVSMSDDEAGVSVHLQLKSDDTTRPHWPADFVADYHVHFGRSLTMRFAVTNTGTATATYEAALHSYLAVSDVREVRVAGLGDVEYIAKAEGGARKRQSTDDLTFTAETDRVYVNTTGTCTLHDTKLGRQIVVDKRGSDSTVVWNPFPARASELKDITDAHWTGFACIETTNALENAVTLAPGGRHETVAIISLKPIETA